MSNLVPIARSPSGAIAIQNNQPVALVDGQILPIQTEQGLELARRLLDGAMPSADTQQAINLAIKLERDAYQRSFSAIQDMAETALTGMQAATGSLAQQNSQLLQAIAHKDEVIATLATRQSQQVALPASPVEVKVDVRDRGETIYYSDPMVWVLFMFFMTVLAVGWFGVAAQQANQQSVPAIRVQERSL